MLVIVYLSIRVVQQYERMVVFRLGKTDESDGPRARACDFLIPIVDRPVQGRPARAVHRGPEPDHDHQGQRPDQRRLPHLLADRRPAQERRRTSPNFPGALQGVATTTLRAVIGDILLDDVLSKREQINEVLRVKLDEVTERWGGKVTTVEIREITPPRDVQDAMNRQLSAERTRRAVITESEGTRQAAINVAEGQKQSEILKAEGDRQAAILRAEGFSEALSGSTAPRRHRRRRRWRSSTSRRSSRSAPARATKFVTIPVEVAGQLASILHTDRAALQKKLSGTKNFCWIARQDRPRTGDLVQELGIEGIFIVKEPKRFYPSGELAGHLIGFVGTDATGLEGLELRYDRYLKGTPEKLLWTRDAKGKRLYPRVERPEAAPKENYNLVLTIDSRIQHLVESHLKTAVKAKGAKGGFAIVMDPRTGEILALANEMGFDPNNFSAVDPATGKNKAITDCFDPGSTFKPFLAAAALEEGVVKETDMFNCENGNYAVADRVIHEAKRKRHGALSFRDILKYSSNIGSVKIGERLGKEKFYQYIRKFGFGAKTGIDLPGEVSGLLRPVETLDTGGRGDHRLRAGDLRHRHPAHHRPLHRRQPGGPDETLRRPGAHGPEGKARPGLSPHRGPPGHLPGDRQTAYRHPDRRGRDGGRHRQACPHRERRRRRQDGNLAEIRFCPACLFQRDG